MLFYDFAFWNYLLILLLSIFGFLIFAWWWKKNQKATVVYAYITLLFLSEGISKVIELYARVLLHTQSEQYVFFLSGWIFSFRNVFQLIVYFLIVHNVSNRIYKTMKGARLLRMKQKESGDKFTGKVLVVEDNKDVCDVMEESLKRYFPRGKVYCASRVSEALDILEEDKEIDIVVTDLRLPGRNGIQLCSLIKDERPWVVVIGVTGYQQEYGLWNARAMGFDDYLIKPFRLGDLIDSIQRESEKIERWHGIWERLEKEGQPSRGRRKEKISRTVHIHDDLIVGNKHKK